MGTLMFLWIFPTLFAWAFWLISRRNFSVLSITFNAALIFAVFSQFTALVQRSDNKTAALDELIENRATLFGAVIDADDDADKIDNAKEKFYENVTATFDKLAKSSHGKEAEFYKIIQKFSAKIQSNERRLDDSIAAAMDESVFDFATLNDGEEAERQIEIIQRYISAAQAYKIYFVTIPANLKSALSAFGDDFPMAVEAMKVANKQIESQRSIMIPLLDTHEAYGQGMVAIIELLTRHQSNWKFTNGSITLDDGANQAQYDAILEQLIHHEETINKLVDKLTSKIVFSAESMGR